MFLSKRMTPPACMDASVFFVLSLSVVPLIPTNIIWPIFSSKDILPVMASVSCRIPVSVAQDSAAGFGIAVWLLPLSSALQPEIRNTKNNNVFNKVNRFFIFYTPVLCINIIVFIISYYIAGD